MAAGEVAVRALALLAGIALGTARSRRGLVLLGLLAAFAAFGWRPRVEESPGVRAAEVLLLTAAAAAAVAATWPPLVGEAVRCAGVLGLPMIGIAIATRPGAPALTLVADGLALLAAVSLFAGEAARANAEAGARRAAYWALAVLVPPGLAAALAAATPALRRSGEWLPAVLACAAALLAFVPAALDELWRVRRELAEEVRLGLLPEADAAILASPWRRRTEKSFGRRDERREYVTSALRLAVARQQQRRRSGEAERLRQLEVLTFRTRIRRLLEARRARLAINRDETE